MTKTMTGVLGHAYKDGEVIYREGEIGDRMYVIQSGQVEVMQREGDKEFCLGTLDAGDFFGEMAMFGDEFHTTTARAVGRTSVLTLERRSFLQGIKDDPSMALRVMQKMSRRIRELEASIVRLGAARIDHAELT